MKQVIKYAAVIFALVLAATIIGGCLTAGVTVVRMIVGQTEENTGENNGIWYRDEDGDVVFLGIHFGNSGDVKSGSETYIGSDIHSLDVEGLSGEIIVEVWDNDFISVEYENIPENYEIYNDDGTLTIEREGGIFLWGTTYTEKQKIHVSVPAGKGFEEIEVENGAGSTKLTGVLADVITVENGAGGVGITGVTAKELQVDSGSGGVSISDTTAELSKFSSGSGGFIVQNSNTGDTSMDAGSGYVNFEEVTAENLVLDSGSGRVNYTGCLTGNCVFDTGSGSINLEIYGEEEDYNIRADLGSGGLYINGTKEKDTYIEYKNASNLLVFDAGSGRISIKFKEAQ